MSVSHLPNAAVAAALPRDIRPQILTPAAEPPTGDGWLHEIKHDGWRIIALIDGRGGLRLLSRQGLDHTHLFRAPFAQLAGAGRAMVLDGELAVPDDKGVTHIDALNDAIAQRRPDLLAYFAFDLLHLDGHDLRRCRIEDRKMLLRDVIGAAGCERVVYVDHVFRIGRELLEAMRQVGAEGVVSKRRGSIYRGGESRDWLKCKVFEIGEFVVTGFQELDQGRLEALHVAEDVDGQLYPAGQVRFGLARRGLWAELDARRAGAAVKRVVPIEPFRVAKIKFFGRYKGGAIRDGVLLSITDVGAAPTTAPSHATTTRCWQRSRPSTDC